MTGLQSCSSIPSCTAVGRASFSVEFDFLWPTSHYNRPSTPAWSPPLYATHSPCAVTWRSGVQSTAGLELLAEDGNNTVIISEIRAFGNHSLSVREGVVLRSATGQDSQTVEVDSSRYVLSALSMIAPSPDWIVGVDSVPLCVNDSFIPNATYDLFPYNANTDSGPNFTSPNSNIDPRGRVSRINPNSGTNLFLPSAQTATPIGRLTVRRMTVNQAASVPNVTCTRCSTSTSGKTEFKFRTISLCMCWCCMH